MARVDPLESELRSRLLSLLFADPAKEYHLRDLERRLGVPVTTLHREVNLLAAEGAIRKRPEGKRLLISLDPAHPEHMEWRDKVRAAVPGLPSAGIRRRVRRRKASVRDTELSERITSLSAKVEALEKKVKEVTGERDEALERAFAAERGLEALEAERARPAASAKAAPGKAPASESSASASSEIRNLACAQCGAPYGVIPRQKGKLLKCPKCGHTTPIPDLWRG